MRIIAFYICVILMLAVSARFIIFQSYIKSQKKAFRTSAIMESRSVKKISIAASQLYNDSEGFIWKEDNKELVIAGVYHEVIRIIPAGSFMYIFLIEDKEENKLFSNFFNNSPHGEYPLLIKTLLSVFFVLPVNYSLLPGLITDIVYSCPSYRTDKGYCSLIPVIPRNSF